MPLTAAQKQARYRERRKQSGKYEEDKQKEAERKKELRTALKTQKREWLNYRKKENARMVQEYKRKKRAQANQHVHEGETPITEVIYKTPQALGKAVTKVKKSLPNSPRKRKIVVERLAKAVGIPVARALCRTRRHANSLDPEIESSVTAFYLRDDISWQAPGKKDRVIIRERNENGQNIKYYIQKRYLIMSIKEAHQCFLSEFPGTQIGLTRFQQVRPKQVDTFTHLPFTVCVCRYHENVRLLLEALSPSLHVPTSFREFISTITCNQDNLSCMSSQCNTCENKIHSLHPRLILVDSERDQNVKFHQWKTIEGKSSKVEFTKPIEKVFEELELQIKPFLMHTFTKRKQSQHFEYLKKNVNGKTVLLQVDFSENFSLKDQNEVQSAHWANDQCTLFTGFAWITDTETQSYVLVSDSLEHGKISVFTYMDTLFKKLKESYPSIEEVNVYSDGAASQFKQRYLFSTLNLFQKRHAMKITWHFFATSHGKGVVDGVGGTVKGSVWRRVLAGTHVHTAEDFCTIAKRCNPKVLINYIPTEEIEKERGMLEDWWLNLESVPNTLKIHCVKASTTDFIIHVADYSFGIGSELRQVALKESVNLVEMEDATDTEDSSIRVGAFVTVKLSSKRTTQHFVAQVVQIVNEEGTVEVNFMKSTDPNHLVFTVEEPPSFVDMDAIMETLPHPVMDNRGRYHFRKSILLNDGKKVG